MASRTSRWGSLPSRFVRASAASTWASTSAGVKSSLLNTAATPCCSRAISSCRSSWAVSTITGIVPVRSSSRMAFSTAKPSITGIIRSSSTRSGRVCVITASASAPLLARSTRQVGICAWTTWCVQRQDRRIIVHDQDRLALAATGFDSLPPERLRQLSAAERFGQMVQVQH